MNQPAFICHPAPPGIAASTDFTLSIAGQTLFVYSTPFASLALLEASAALEVEIRPAFAFQDVVVRPLSRGVTPLVKDGVVRFAAPAATPNAPTFLSVEFMDETGSPLLRKPLLLLVSPPEANPPDPNTPGVIYLEAGKVHDLGQVNLASNQTLYIAGGAILRGNIFAERAGHIAIRGRGILDGSAYSYETAPNGRLVRLQACRDVLIEGITILDGRTWELMPWNCEDVTIRDVKIVSHSASDDGIDLVASRNVLVENCFVRTKDDCIAIKGFDYLNDSSGLSVEKILVQNCVFWNAEWGNALEIGYETCVDHMRDITFRNCDVIHCEAERYGSGGVLTIHNGDRAVISDVLYEDIRVEDAQEKLVDFKICFDRYSRDEQRGQIRNITLRNVRVVAGPLPVSIIQGYSADHIPTGITFEDVSLHGQPARSPADLRLVTEKIREICFVVEGVKTCV